MKGFRKFTPPVRVLCLRHELGLAGVVSEETCTIDRFWQFEARTGTSGTPPVRPRDEYFPTFFFHLFAVHAVIFFAPRVRLSLFILGFRVDFVSSRSDAFLGLNGVKKQLAGIETQYLAVEMLRGLTN